MGDSLKQLNTISLAIENGKLDKITELSAIIKENYKEKIEDIEFVRSVYENQTQVKGELAGGIANVEDYWFVHAVVQIVDEIRNIHFKPKRGFKSLVSRIFINKNAQNIIRKLTTGDDRIKELVENDKEPDKETIAYLIYKYCNDHRTISKFVYVEQGKSGAKVFRLLFQDGGISEVVKIGKSTTILKERNNYADILRFLGGEFLITNMSTANGIHKSLHFNRHSAISYQWASGYDKCYTFEELFKNQVISKCNSEFERFCDKMMIWHQIKNTQSNNGSKTEPFKQWHWKTYDKFTNIIKAVFKYCPENLHNKMISRILNHKYTKWKDEYSQSLDYKQKEIIYNSKLPKEWWNFIGDSRCSYGKCHGDLNSTNILFSKRNSVYKPILIDFANFEPDISPAYDWTKLERDLKFRCLSKHCGGGSISKYNEYLEYIDNALAFNTKSIPSSKLPKNVNDTLELLKIIRNKFCNATKKYSGYPYLEYLFYLFYRTLTYINDKDTNNEINELVVGSACRISDEIDAFVKNGILMDKPAYIP